MIVQQLGAGPRRALLTVPVVPGPEPVAAGPCVACGDRGMRAWQVVGTVDVILCIDAEGCRRRFMADVS